MGKKNGMGSHQSHNMQKDEWLTPRVLIAQLGPFDLDPCSPINRPWDTARKHFTIEDDGLNQDWFLLGKVWCNPPYGKETGKWLEKLADHGNGIALIFARTETSMFFEEVWKKADAVLFLEGRLFFHHVDGTRAKSNAGAPSVLVAYGTDCANRLRWFDGILGKYIDLKTAKPFSFRKKKSGPVQFMPESSGDYAYFNKAGNLVRCKRQVAYDDKEFFHVQNEHGVGVCVRKNELFKLEKVKK